MEVVVTRLPVTDSLIRDAQERLIFASNDYSQTCLDAAMAPWCDERDVAIAAASLVRARACWMRAHQGAFR